MHLILLSFVFFVVQASQLPLKRSLRSDLRQLFAQGLGQRCKARLFS